MSLWNTLRSMLATEIMHLAIRITPPEEKVSALMAFTEHLHRCLRMDVERLKPAEPVGNGRRRPPSERK